MKVFTKVALVVLSLLLLRPSLSSKPSMRKWISAFFVLSAFSAFALLGCASHPVHFADGQNIPLFEKAGQVQASLGYQFEKGLQSTVAVAVTPRLALHMGGAYAQQDNCHSCSKEVTRHLDLGIETFRKLENGSLQGLLLGGGLGRFKTFSKGGRWDPPPEALFVSSSNYNEFFLQGHWGKRGPIWERAGSLRVSAFRFFDFQAWDGDETTLAYPSQHWGFYLEPAFTFRAGFKAVKGQIQTGISLPLYQAGDLDNSKLWLNFGLFLNAAALAD